MIQIAIPSIAPAPRVDMLRRAMARCQIPVLRPGLMALIAVYATACGAAQIPAPRIVPSPIVATAPAPEPAMAPAASVDSPVEDYQLGVADKVRIIVFNEPTLSGEFVVNANGSLSFPLIGDIVAKGLTPGQVARSIADRLKDGYVLAPSVSIDVLTFRPFYILGEVNKPGEYPFSNGLTVDAAVAMAQGYTYRAEKRRVFIRHKGEADSRRVVLSPDLKVAPGDTIRIGERHW